MKGNYSAVAAKLKAMSANSLTQEDFDELLSKATVGEVYSYLMSKEGYRNVLSEIAPGNIRRAEIERCLRHEMIREYGRIYNFIDSEQKDVLRFWFVHREVEFLKRGLRRLFNRENDDWIEAEDELEEFFEKHTKLDCKGIKVAQNLDRVIEACADTPYADVLRRSQNLGAGYFMMAMSLDRFYYESAWRTKDKYLRGSEKRLFEDVFGMEIDINNILWIYRSKKYFQIPQEIIVTYLIPIRHTVSEELIKQLLQASSAEEVVKIISATKYADIFNGINDGFFPEENAHRMHSKRLRQCFRTNTESVAAIYAYFELKENEISAITNVIESIRYDIDKQIVKRHINIGWEG